MVIAWIEEQAHCAQVISKIKAPILFAKAEYETLVSNDFIDKFFVM